MKRLAVLLVVAIFTFLVLLFMTHPEWLDKVWLWVIGFIGYILVLIEKSGKILSEAWKNKVGQEGSPIKNSLQEVPDGMATVSQVEMLEKRLTQIENQLQKQPR
jgi:uncharacterized membrane protein YbhN (UPF0104 family)